MLPVAVAVAVAVGENVALLRHPLLSGFEAAGAAGF